MPDESRILQLLAKWLGMDHVEPKSAHDLLSSFTLDALPKEPIVFTAADDAFLLAGAS